MLFLIDAELPGCGSGADRASLSAVCDREAAVLTSPGYPHQSESHTIRYDWTIRTAPATYINLTFAVLDLPSEHHCELNYVAVLDGDGDGSAAGGALLGKYCNAERPPGSILSSRNSLVVNFRFNEHEHEPSAGDEAGRGFYAVYRSLTFEPHSQRTSSDPGMALHRDADRPAGREINSDKVGDTDLGRGRGRYRGKNRCRERGRGRGRDGG